jgi:hypothetical protein
MAQPRRRKRNASEVAAGSTDELVRLIALQLKYAIPQSVLIHDMTKSGIGPTRIADLLGTTPGTVNMTKRRKRPQWPPKNSG